MFKIFVFCKIYIIIKKNNNNNNNNKLNFFNYITFVDIFLNTEVFPSNEFIKISPFSETEEILVSE